MKAMIFGGMGFVGSRAAQALVAQRCEVSCVSRTGQQPVQLREAEWAQQVSWLQADAGEASVQLIKDADVLISTVGAPPIPTFSENGYEQSLRINGEVNAKLIETAKQAGINRVILLGAKIPAPLRGDWFAYAKGKRLAATAAKNFAQTSGKHSAVVIQPGGIFGKRHTANGREIPIDLFLGPVAKLLPSQLISVDRVAQCIADAALGLRATTPSYCVITHDQI